MKNAFPDTFTGSDAEREHEEASRRFAKLHGFKTYAYWHAMVTRHCTPKVSEWATLQAEHDREIARLDADDRTRTLTAALRFSERA